MPFHVCFVVGREAVVGNELQDLALRTDDARHIRLAKARCRLDKRVQDSLQVEGRAADDLEHVGGGGLLLQRVAQLIEQPRVLDRDDSLGGEIP